MSHSLKHFFKSTRTRQVGIFPTLLILGAFIVGWMSRTWYDQVVVSPVPNEEVEVQEPEQLKVIYEVQVGDSLWSIADGTYGNGYRYIEIAEANQLHSEARLEVGQKLILPVTQFPTGEVEQDPNTITVQPGDSLWSLAETNMGSGHRWQELYRLNQAVLGSNPNAIYPGQTLVLPSN